MAAPLLDNPYGAKPQPSEENKPDALKSTKSVEESDEETDNEAPEEVKKAPPKPKCAHEFCNLPSDPSNYPVGLPWASGKLKCLPGYCKKHKKEIIESILAGDAEKAEMPEKPEPTGPKEICRCKSAKVVCPVKKEENQYKRIVYGNDPEMEDELKFFLRVMMIGKEMDELEEEERKKRKRSKKKNSKKNSKSKGPEGASKSPSQSKNSKKSRNSKKASGKDRQSKASGKDRQSKASGKDRQSKASGKDVQSKASHHSQTSSKGKANTEPAEADATEET